MTNELDTPESYDDLDELEKSKTQVKQEMKDITQFGMELAELSLSNLKKLPLTDTIIEAYQQLDRVKGNEARKRHFKFIGKRLREIDIEPIELALARFKQGLPLIEPQESNEPSESDLWFNRLFHQDENPESFIEAYPHCERQQLRQLLRNAKKSPKNQGKLKSFIQEMVSH